MSEKEMLENIEKLDRETLTPKDIAPILGMTQYTINQQVKKDKERGVNSFPFHTILTGSRVRIPKRSFLEAMMHAVKYPEEATP